MYHSKLKQLSMSNNKISCLPDDFFEAFVGLNTPHAPTPRIQSVADLIPPPIPPLITPLSINETSGNNVPVPPAPSVARLSVPTHQPLSLIYLDVSFNKITNLDQMFNLTPKRLAMFQKLDFSGNPICNDVDFLDRFQKVYLFFFFFFFLIKKYFFFFSYGVGG
jgi:Leucine-rich repeat (LRR) protein